MGTAPREDVALVKLEESLTQRTYRETVRPGQSLLAGDPANAPAREYLKKAGAEITASEVAHLLQSGIASYGRGDYAQCVDDMEKALRSTGTTRRPRNTSFQAQAALAEPEITALIERHRVAEENKDLLTVLSLFEQPGPADSLQAEYRLLFNGYDGIKSVISKVRSALSSRASATAAFSELLTAVYKKTGQRKIVFEGQKTWRLRKQGSRLENQRRSIDSPGKEGV